MNEVILEIRKRRIANIADLTEEDIRQILKKLNRSKYYEHRAHILSRLNGNPPPTITPEIEEKIRAMFQDIQALDILIVHLLAAEARGLWSGRLEELQKRVGVLCGQCRNGSPRLGLFVIIIQQVHVLHVVVLDWVGMLDLILNAPQPHLHPVRLHR